MVSRVRATLLAHAFLPLGIAKVMPRTLHKAPSMGSLGFVAWARKAVMTAVVSFQEDVTRRMIQ